MEEFFKCSNCGRTFAKERSDAATLAESEKLWGKRSLIDLEIVCDDCFKMMTAKTPPERFLAEE